MVQLFSKMYCFMNALLLLCASEKLDNQKN